MENNSHAFRLLMSLGRFKSKRIAEAAGGTSHATKTDCVVHWLTSFVVISNPLLDEGRPDMWTVPIRMPAFEPGDVPVLVAFMHTDEPQCAM
jgi:hypothetical protein